MPGGLFLNHGIARLHSEPPPPDTFLTRYVFPDGELHPVTDVMDVDGGGRASRSATSSRCASTTRSRCATGWPTSRRIARTPIAEIGEQRERVWRLYMLASALGFEAADVTVYQVLGTRPDAPHGLPLVRTHVVEHAEVT